MFGTCTGWRCLHCGAKYDINGKESEVPGQAYLEAHIKELSSSKICDKIDSLTLAAYETEFQRLKAKCDKFEAFVQMIVERGNKVWWNHNGGHPQQVDIPYYDEACELLETFTESTHPGNTSKNDAKINTSKSEPPNPVPLDWKYKGACANPELEYWRAERGDFWLDIVHQNDLDNKSFYLFEKYGDEESLIGVYQGLDAAKNAAYEWLCKLSKEIMGGAV
jgi:hypothetical protein